MTSRVLVRTPWFFVDRAKYRLDTLVKSVHQSKQHFSATFQLQHDTPAMEALKRVPYPTTPLDASIFEDASPEYERFADGSQIQRPPKTSVDTLVDLLEKRRYATAERVLGELSQIGVQIPLNSVYEKAAIAIIRTPRLKNRVEAFARWFSLIPMACDSKPRSFHAISHLLFYKALVPDVSLVSQFGLICASKGYARKVASQVIPCVVRLAGPSVSSRFLDEFETLARQYLQRHYPSEINKMLKGFRGLAVRGYCLSGHSAEAVKIFRACRVEGIPLSRSTCITLLRKLEQRSDTLDYDIITELRSNCSLPDTAHTIVELPALLHTGLPSKIRMLRHSLVSSNPPDAYTLSSIIAEYRETGRSAALILLRRKAYRHSRKATRLWATAEMLYHAQRDDHAMVMVTFIRHFQVVGIPRALIVRQLRRLSQARKAQPNQFQNLVPRPCPTTIKLLPTSIASRLLWQALAVLSENIGQLEQVYSELLGFARSGRSSSPASPVSPLRYPTLAIRQDHFTPLIRLFNERDGPKRAMRIITDMLSLDIQPSRYHHAILAVSFAHVGDADTAFALLDRSESADTELTLVAHPETAGNPSRDPSSDFTLTTYTKLMYAFMKAQHYDAALEVDERLLRKLGYVPGTDPLVDRARSLLHGRVEPTGHSSITFFLRGKTMTI